MGALLDELKRNFDLILIDGTPSKLVTDAVILSRIVDSTIIVTSHNETKKEDLAKVKKSLESVGASIAGVVINKVPMNAKKYENTYYYGSSNKDNSREFSNINIKLSKEDEIKSELDAYFKDKYIGE